MKMVRFSLLALVCSVVLIVGQNLEAQRITQLFDEGWAFQKGVVENGQAVEMDDGAWRKVDLPHDWSIEDLPAVQLKEDVAENRLLVTEGQWRFKKGDDMAWKAADLKDADWEKVTLPAFWEFHSKYNEDNVYGWYRRTVTITPELAGREVELAIGKIDDVDESFWDGQKIGGLGGFPPGYVTAYSENRIYKLPAQLATAGEHVLAIRVFDGNGGGGLYAAVMAHKRNGPFDSTAVGASSTGNTVGGTAWYRKHFEAPQEWKGKRVRVMFDGVYMNADVWLNGKHLGNHPYGYTGFGYDLTDDLNYGGKNVLAVEVKNEGRNSRWYSGSGIYRHVWLTATAPVAVEPWGACITTPQVSEKEAVVEVNNRIGNRSGKRQELTIETTLISPEGVRLTSKAVETLVSAGEPTGCRQIFTVTAPALWSPDSPRLYKAVTVIKQGGSVVDEVQTSFGIRSLEFSAVKGFLLNGLPVELKGGCMHHDNGPLGAAAFDRAEERRVELMKASGFNAIRCAHNPPSPAFLEACDRLGMLVIDEIFDHWMVGKNGQDYHLYYEKWWQRDLESMVLRDRNHPSVIIWSIGNEVPEQLTDAGVQLANQLAAATRTLDPTRPVTAALCCYNDRAPEPFFGALDISGYNYKLENYQGDHERNPDRIMMGTESHPKKAFENWMQVIDNDYVIGDFVWTGFDYLGEASIGWHGFSGNEYPWTVAYCGDLDICGFKRAQSYYRDVLWGNGSKVAALVYSPEPTFGKPSRSDWDWQDVHASWNWEGQEGKPLKVEVYSGCEKVRLLVNGKDYGVKPTNRQTRMMATWDEVAYEPGKLEAVGYGGDKEVARWTLATAGKPAAIKLAVDRQTIKAGGQDLAYVTVEVVDEKGQRCPFAVNSIHVELTGPGVLAALGNGKPDSVESFQQPDRTVFEGRALAIIRSGKGAGAITLKATGEGLKLAEVTVKQAE